MTCGRIEVRPELIAELVISTNNPDPNPLGLTGLSIDSVENRTGDTGNEEDRVERGVHEGLFLAPLADQLQQLLYRLDYVLQQHCHRRVKIIPPTKPLLINKS